MANVTKKWAEEHRAIEPLPIKLKPKPMTKRQKRLAAQWNRHKFGKLGAASKGKSVLKG
jgi:hypothetical protein